MSFNYINGLQLLLVSKIGTNLAVIWDEMQKKKHIEHDFYLPRLEQDEQFKPLHLPLPCPDFLEAPEKSRSKERQDVERGVWEIKI
ncbi:MAG: hypothetical protein KDD48_08635 [Bdellovibrionales bacterium]|nr:hypothetical protein [Bdellovibrionales bacterium]